MALDVSDVRELIRLLRENPELRDAARAELIDEDMRALPLIVRRLSESQDRATDQLRELVEAQRRTDARLEALIAAQERTDASLQVVSQRLDELTRRVEDLAHAQLKTEAVVAKLFGRVDNLEGWRYETEFKADHRLGDLVRRPRRVPPADLDPVMDALDAGLISDQEWEQLKATDAFFRGRPRKGADGEEVVVVLEISRTVAKRDVERAATRAALLERCGVRAIAAAGGQEVNVSAADLARSLGVRILVDRTREANATADSPDE
ncbi:MAG: hypothetical protein ACKVVT_04000 [Dehalococcoidia bacterium]